MPPDSELPSAFLLLFIGAIGAVINTWAIRRAFFVLPYKPKERWLHFGYVLITFALYIAAAGVCAPLLTQWFGRTFGPFPPKILLGIAQLVMMGLTFSFWAPLFSGNRFPLLRRILGPLRLSDAGIGVVTVVLSLPVALFVEEGLEWINWSLFHVQSPDQLAVRYLMQSLGNPFTLAVACLLIIVAAPCFEEFLFRGLLQTYLRGILGTKGGIALTAAVFAAFHFSPNQGIGNIPLISALFLFAIYLGIIYEKRSALLAPIVAHATFNLATTLYILVTT